MSRNKPALDARGKITLLKSVDVNSAGMGAKELLDEIDNLALLLHEVKQQTDRIEAAADAIGDAILNRLGSNRASSYGTHTTKRSIAMQPKNSSRVRSLPLRAPAISGIRP
jgi:hypothetical protein